MMRFQYIVLVWGRLKEDKMESKNKKFFELHNYLDVKGSPNKIIGKILENQSRNNS